MVPPTPALGREKPDNSSAGGLPWRRLRHLLVPHQRILKNPYQGLCVQAPLHQVILSAPLHGVRRQEFAADPGQNHDRQPRRLPLNRLEGRQPLGIRQGEVQKSNIEFVVCQRVQAVQNRSRAANVECKTLGRAQHFAHQPGVVEVVFY